jgi:hypothetical protein
MKLATLLIGFSGALSLAAQQATVPPLELTLRCTGVETGPQSRAVKSAAYGFGNPTHPDDDEFTKHQDRVVLIELHGESGRIYLPKAVLAVAAHAVAEGWFALEKIAPTPDVITAGVALDAPGKSLHIDRRTGAAELLGYGKQPLKGVCRVDRKPQQF